MTALKAVRLGAALGMTALAGWAGMAYAADTPRETSFFSARGLMVIPASSQARRQDAGVRAHTNTRILFPQRIKAPASSPPAGYETPASLACVYGFVTKVSGCNPATVTAVPTGGSKVVIIVDAYDYPTATNDLTVFSKQFGLPAITANNFQVVYATGTKPPKDPTGGWELEAALDIEMAHAMAPNAEVILMETASNNDTDLLLGETQAAALATAAGGGEVSNSWGGGEFSGEDSYESTFAGSNVVFLASTGDSSGTEWPSVLQNVIGAGGTTINRSNGNTVSQTSWSDGGGGDSFYVPVPTYQSAVKKIAKIVKKHRGVPDFSFDANPNSGVAIYDTTAYEGQVLNWLAVGGTSVSSPALAGVINSAGSFAASTPAELTKVYAGYTNTANWTDITSGVCGNGSGNKAKKGYDFCTGIGVPYGYGGK